MPAIIYHRNVAINRVGKNLSRRFLSQHRSPAAFNAFIHGPHDGLVEAIRFKDRHLPVEGQRIAIKDNICVSGIPTTCASDILKNFHSPFDATVIEKLKNGGAILTGKTNMDEFGMGSHSIHSHFGAVKSQGLDGEVDRSAGGSSGGSAIAVAKHLGDTYGALGTDTGGSVRLPAAYTSTAGFKPSYGVVSRWGVVAYANSLDTVGIITGGIGSMESIFDTIKGFDPKDPTSLRQSTRDRIEAIHEMGKLQATIPAVEETSNKESTSSVHRRFRIGVPLEYNIAELAPEVREAWVTTLQCCEQAGHEIVPISLPTTKLALSAYYVLAPAEASSNLAKYDGVRYGSRSGGSDGMNGVLFSDTRSKGFGDEVKRRILLGSYTLSAVAIDNYFIQAQRVRRLVQDDFDHVFRYPNALRQSDITKPWNPEGVDFLIVPTAPTPPPSLEEVSLQTPLQAYMNDVFTVPASLAGLPAMSVPYKVMTKNPQAPHIGIQIIAQFGMDKLVLKMASKLFKYFRTARNTSHRTQPAQGAPTFPIRGVGTPVATGRLWNPKQAAQTDRSMSTLVGRLKIKDVPTKIFVQRLLNRDLIRLKYESELLTRRMSNLNSEACTSLNDPFGISPIPEFQKETLPSRIYDPGLLTDCQKEGIPLKTRHIEAEKRRTIRQYITFPAPRLRAVVHIKDAPRISWKASSTTAREEKVRKVKNVARKAIHRYRIRTHLSGQLVATPKEYAMRLQAQKFLKSGEDSDESAHGMVDHLRHG